MTQTSRRKHVGQVASALAKTIPTSQDRTAAGRMRLLARATVARRLVIDGAVDGPLALSFAVWPSPAILEREAQVGYGTLTGRAFGKRCNP